MSGMLLDFVYEFVMGLENGDDDDEGLLDDGFDNEDEDVIIDADVGVSTSASRGVKLVSGVMILDRIILMNNSDGILL